MVLAKISVPLAPSLSLSFGVVPALQPKCHRRHEQQDQYVFHFASNFSSFSSIVPLLLEFAADYPLPRCFWSLNVAAEGGYWERQVEGSWVRRGAEEKFTTQLSCGKIRIQSALPKVQS